MIVKLPKRFTRETMYEFIELIIDKDMNPRGSEITFDFTSLRFIRPVGVTVLSNLIGKLHKQGSKITFKCPEPNRANRKCPIAFLDDSMFFKHYLNETLDAFSSLRSTTLPLENVSYSGSFEYLEKTMQWLANRLYLSKKSLADIEICLKEVFNNINDHSLENIGSVFVQHYPNEREVMIAISDFGVGIPHNMRKLYPSLTDEQTLVKAIQHGITTKSSPRNSGAGLDTLMHNVVVNNKGKVYIHSNHGILNCTYNNFGMSVVPQISFGFYPGTLLEIVFRTDTIENIEEEFSWDDY